MTPLTQPEIEALVLSWKNRAEGMGYKPGTKTYAKMEAEFFIGIIAALLALKRSHPPLWELLIMSGRSISQTYNTQSSAPTSTEGQP